MNVSYLGHSCYFVEVGRDLVLIDPLLTETFQMGTAAVDPMREIIQAALPVPQFIFISHFHSGHLESASLALLPKNTPVFHPADSSIELVLDQMGFSSCTRVSAGDVIELSAGRMIVTGSQVGFEALGIALQDDDGSFWYMGDRGDTIDPDELQAVVAELGDIGLCVPSHPSDQHGYFTFGELGLGAHDSENIVRWLERCLNASVSVGAALTCPNTVGYTYLNQLSWLNSLMFPMSPQAFTKELRRIAPATRTTILNPGDVVSIVQREAVVNRDAATYVKRAGSASQANFDPWKSIPAVKDHNLRGESSFKLEAQVESFLHTELTTWLREYDSRVSCPISSYVMLGLDFTIHVVFPDERETKYSIDFAQRPLEFHRASGPSQSVMNYRIPASVLVDWANARIPHFVAWPYGRTWTTPFGMAGRLLDSRIVLANSTPLTNPVALFLNGTRTRVLHPWLQSEIARSVPEVSTST